MDAPVRGGPTYSLLDRLRRDRESSLAQRPSGPGSSDSPLPPCPDEGLAVAQESSWVSGTTWTAASSAEAAPLSMPTSRAQ